MNIPSLAIAAVPVARLASITAREVIDLGMGFASHLGESPAKAKVELSQVSRLQDSHSRLDNLVRPLQAWLKSLGIDQQSSIELATDGLKSIAVDADPHLKQAVENWLNANPDWTAAWQAAVRQYLSESASGPPEMAKLWSIPSEPPVFRSTIGVSSVEHWKALGDHPSA